jgi:hypothetical protein
MRHEGEALVATGVGACGRRGRQVVVAARGGSNLFRCFAAKPRAFAPPE